jgi:hypothetical protein
MQWRSLPILSALLLASACYTFGGEPEFTAVDPGDAGEGEESMPDAATDSGVDLGADTGVADTGVADMGDAGLSETTPIAVPFDCGSEPSHIQIDGSTRIVNDDLDDDISLVATYGANISTRLFWSRSWSEEVLQETVYRGEQRAVNVDIDFEDNGALALGDPIDVEGLLGPAASAFEIVGWGVSNQTSSELAIGIAGFNCGDPAGNQTRAAGYLAEGVWTWAEFGVCGDFIDRSQPLALLPAFAGGYDPATGDSLELRLVAGVAGGLMSFGPGDESAPVTDIREPPSRSSWTRGTTGRLIYFSDTGLVEPLVWDAHNPSAQPVEVTPPEALDAAAGLTGIAMGRAQSDFVHVGGDRYLHAYLVDGSIRIDERVHDIASGDVRRVRRIDEIQTSDREDADIVRIVTYPGGFALFYLDDDPAGANAAERWTIQPYRWNQGEGVGRLTCPYVYNFGADIDIHDAELVALSRPGEDGRAIVAAVNYSVGGGTRTINVEGAWFPFLP